MFHSQRRSSRFLENPDDACKMTRAAFKGAITQFIEKAVDVPVVAQRQIRMNLVGVRVVSVVQAPRDPTGADCGGDN